MSNKISKQKVSATKKKVLTKNRKQKLAQFLAFFLVGATLLGTVAGYGVSLVGNTGNTYADAEHTHYYDKDGNVVHLEDILATGGEGDVHYYDEHGNELHYEDIVNNNTDSEILYYDMNGNLIDIETGEIIKENAIDPAELTQTIETEDNTESTAETTN